FTGNRGCLVDERGEVVRHHVGDLWITCLLEYRGWRHPTNAPRRWTQLFFLDDAVALAAGHRPCGQCRRDDYLSYQVALGGPSAPEMNRRLAAERGRIWSTAIEDLPSGTVIQEGTGVAAVVLEDRLLAFSFGGWTNPVPRPVHREVTVLTPPTSVVALRNGFRPVLHPTVG
ncbi:MAG: hypothetical protein ACR2ME_00145, partial [Acidimicrobiia bacterium]